MITINKKEEFRPKIQEKLRVFLNREPTENEVINGFTDQNILNSILVDEINILKEEIGLLKKNKV